VLLLGENEMAAGAATKVKWLADGTQTERCRLAR